MLGKTDSPQRPLENKPSIAAIQTPALPASNVVITPVMPASTAISAPMAEQTPRDVPTLQLSVALQAHSAPPASVASTTTNRAPHAAAADTKTSAKQNVSESNLNPPVKNMAAPGSLLQQRLNATRDILSHADKSGFSIQLYYTDDPRPSRIEGFLSRAQSLGKLSEIYVIPIKIKGKDGFRVLYGVYPNSAAAHIGMQNLPQRYKDAFAPTLNTLDSY